jgi:hypothetical protein
MEKLTEILVEFKSEKLTLKEAKIFSYFSIILNGVKTVFFINI